MNLMDMVVSGNNVAFDDYSLQCHKSVYQTFAGFWSGTISSGDCVSKIRFYDEEGTQEVLIIYLSIWKMESSFYMT